MLLRVATVQLGNPLSLGGDNLASRIWRSGQPEAISYYAAVGAEALTNVAKHAHASNVLVDVQATDGVGRVSVSAAGVGGADPSCGSGLLGLRDRVDALGGTISLARPLLGDHPPR
jgi:glucose-6-phosphate-specific signal transduction histidine kinase